MGGVGYDVSNLRRENAPVNNSAMSSSGGVTFMERFSNTTKEVGQHNRRGALLLSCSVKTPFAQDFLNAKTDRTSVSGANISLKLDNEFMHAVEHNEMYKQHWEYANGYVEDNDLNASKFFANIVENAWAHAEPGILFWDTILKWSNGRAYGKKYTEVSSNPCVPGNTIVAVADGRNGVSIEELANENKEFLVYSARKYNTKWGAKINKWKTEIKPAFAFCTGIKHTIKLTLSDGSIFECTPDHKLALADGTYIEAKDSLNQMLAKFFTFSNKWNNKSYRHINTITNAYNKQSTMIAHYLYGHYDTKQFELHHKDSDSTNDLIDNLELVTKVEHKTKRLVNPLTKRKGTEYMQLYVQRNQICANAKRCSWPDERLQAALQQWDSIHAEHLQELRIQMHGTNVYMNEPVYVVSIEDLGEQKVYDLHVQDNHNFYIINKTDDDRYLNCSGILIHNCGEQVLPAYSSCMLLHVNLSNYVINAWSSNAYVAFEALDRDVRKIARIADDFNDLEQEAIQRILNKIASDPESEEVKYRELHLWQHIQEMLINCRRYGLGFMGLGDVFAKIGVTYGTQESINIAEQIQSTMTIACYETSIELAKERGSFPIFDKTKDLQSNFVQHVLEHVDAEHLSMYHEHGRRNMYCNCVAPTGSTAIMTQTTSGIEPVFMPISKRRRKQTVMDSDDKVTFVDDATGEKFIEYIVVHQPLLEWMMKCVSFEFNDANSIIDFTVHKPIVIDINTDRCNQFKTLLLNLSADLRQQIFKASPYYKSTTEDVDWLGKVELQGAIQKWVDNAISVTINIPNSSTKELVHDIYMTAWKSGCKGCTIYRDGSRSGVLVSVDNNANNAKSNAKSNSYVLANGKRSKRKPVLPAQIYTFRIKGEYWCIFIGIDNGKPYEVFAFKPTEDEFNQLQQMVDNGVTTTITKVKKKVYRLGDNCSFIKAYNDIIKRFDMDEQQTITRLYSTMLRNGVGLDEIVDQTEKSTAALSSFCKAIGRALKTFIAEGTSLYEKCPQCGGDLVKFDGCTRCKNCGFSKCG